MKCPILTAACLSSSRLVEEKHCNCLKEECAWWDEADSYCCIIDIASSLSLMMHSLSNVYLSGIPKEGGY